MKIYWSSIIAFGLLSSSALADDTEIYLGTANRVNPNVIFIFDTSGSMRTAVGNETRLSIVKRAAKDTIKDISGINLALMEFDDKTSSQDNGGYLSTAMKSIDDDVHRKNINDTIDDYEPSTWTPIAETVDEALRFLRGESVDYGKYSYQTDNWICTRWRNDRCRDGYYETAVAFASHSDTHRNGQYISPITDQCQKNHIVLFTDGDATYDNSSDTRIRGLISKFSDADLQGTGLSKSCSTNSGGNSGISYSCLEELAYSMYNSDNSTSLPGKQQIHFHSVGGFLGNNAAPQIILANAATHGGGISAMADDYTKLKIALTKIFDDISSSAGTFSAPAVAVNAFNSLEQLDQLYYSVFKPHEAVGWSGNVKRFRMTTDGTIVDSKGNSAVDPTTGFFNKNAQSFWTQDADAPDGDNVVKGGIASRLPLYRKVVTNIAGNDLSASNNRVHEDNTSLNRTLMGTSLSGSEYKKLVQWARGLDVKASSASNPRRAMEDPLHSRPVLLNYGQTTDASGKKIPDSTLFIGTNSGYLHAFDTNADSPKERFAFIPKELLPVVTAYYQGGGVKKYGLDGPISVWHDDTNRDQIINNSEKAYLYIGMRRGGSSYYAIDVSNRDAPKVLWQINGRDHPNTTSGFERLGQTWSRMTPVDVTWTDGNKRKVLIFGGGYDPKEDNYAVRTTHEQGNAIYMVDAKTGSLLWSTSSDSAASLRLTGMKSGIVGNIVAVDDDSDGDVDILYAADLGGRLWRIDFLPGASSSNRFAQGGLIADLGADSSRANNVRFFTSPDVVYSEYGVVWQTDAATGKTVSVEGKGRYQIALGSGYRAHPLNEDANDFFYVVNDYAVDGAPESYPGLKKADLANYSNYDNASYTLKNNGLYYDLPGTGEKVLSNSVTLADTIYFTTYQPVDPASRSGCEADTGKAKLYKIKPTYEDRRTIEQKDLVQPGIVSEPVVIKPPLKEDGDGDPSLSLLIGAEIEKIELLGNPLRKTYWREQEQ